MIKNLFITMMILNSLNAEFINNGSTVIDNSTNLQWQDDDIGFKKTWKQAIDLCEDKSLDSFDDWRLPNINELRSIVNRNLKNLKIFQSFKNTEYNIYWTSTTKAITQQDWAIGVDFNSGRVSTYKKEDAYRETEHYVRCVRSK